MVIRHVLTASSAKAAVASSTTQSSRRKLARILASDVLLQDKRTKQRGMSEEEKTGLTLQDMVKAKEWSDKRSRIALSGQGKFDTGELDKRGVREQSKGNTAVG